MKHILLICIILSTYTGINAQHTFSLSVKKAVQNEPLSGATATITTLHTSAVADSNGIAVFNNIAAGTYTIIISYAGLETKEISVALPKEENTVIDIALAETEEEEEEVIVTATRTSRSISDIPTRVETISGEELAEKANMKPGDIRMLLSETTGIQTQQTSATSYNSSIRIQGLDGRYTQILKDGFPLYAGFSGGLSLMQVAPLDLKQIEVIKGSSSTLYGGGAIAGLVNLVSRTPTAERVLDFLANATSAGGLDLSGFYSQKFKQVGLTVFGSRNTAKAYDPADIGFTAIPEFERYTINPRLFIYGKKTSADVGFSYITENRIGGSMAYIDKGTSGYFENNSSERFTTQAKLTHTFTEKRQFEIKNSFSMFDRAITLPDYRFQGTQQSTFSEATYSYKLEKAMWVGGVNFLTDNFQENRNYTNLIRDYHYNTIGGFLQNTWSPTAKFTLETGLRGDYVQQYGFELLPRISAMLKPTEKLTLRLGGGSGYKTPTLFNEEAEKTHFQDILAINPANTFNERSAGGNFDINFRTTIGNIGFTINQLFFYTKLDKPLVLQPRSGGYEFVNTTGHIDTKGMETNLRFTLDDFKLFVGYTYADVESHSNHDKKWFPLTARHRLNNVLMYEKDEKLKIGLEAYYFSRQMLNDGTMGKSFWTFGLMGEKVWKHFSLFLNFENFTDTRQSRFDNIYTGTMTSPVFKDIYAPVDGFVMNGGIKLRL